MRKKILYFFIIIALIFVFCFLFISKSFLNLSINNNIQSTHLSTEDGWSNDLQTIIWNEADKSYDIYFLHSADGATNPFGESGQDWVHTSTKDFITYSKQSSAIAANGGDKKEGWKSAWTGSIIKNTGWISDIPEEAPLAYFTGLNKSDSSQNIYLAYSDDNGKTFKHPLNDGKPILTTNNSYNKSDFRDPYVFEYNHKLFMYVAEGDVIGVYQSEDGLSWSPSDTSGSKILSETFFKGRNWSGNAPVECPVIKTMTTPDNQKKQVLFFGAKDSEKGETTGTYYIVGHLDDKGLFIDETDVKRLDQGSDYYGANFSGSSQIEDSNGNLLTLGWVGNWNYFTNGIHSDQQAESSHMERIGFYSSPRILTLNQDLSLEQKLHYDESQLKLRQEHLNITKNKPVSKDRILWEDKIVDKNLFGLYDIPNQSSSALYRLEFSSTSDNYSGDIAIAIWQGSDSILFSYNPNTGQYLVKSYASELLNGLDQEKSETNIYNNGLFGKQEGFTANSGYLNQKHISITVVTDNRSVEFFFPNGSTYTIARFNTSGKQDFKVFTDDPDSSNKLDLSIYDLKK